MLPAKSSEPLEAAEFHNFVLGPRAFYYPVHEDTETPEIHNDFVVVNSGKVQITAEVEFGTRQKRIGSLTSVVVEPGVEQVLHVGNKKYQVTAVKITNHSQKITAFQVLGGDTTALCWKNVCHKVFFDASGAYNGLLDEDVYSESDEEEITSKFDDDVNTIEVNDERDVIKFLKTLTKRDDDAKNE